MIRGTLIVWLAALAALFASPGAGASGAELKKLHILLAFDTNSDLASQLVIDRFRLPNVLRHGIPRNRMTLTVLTGNNVTPEKVIAHYRALKVAKDEGLFFFYGGHGAYDTSKGG